MKKIILSILVLVSLALSAGALAQGWTTAVQTLPQINPITVIGRVADLIFTILIAIAAIFLIYAAFLFVTAAGSPEQIERGKHIILYAAIGVAAAFLARGLVMFITHYMPTGGGGAPAPPPPEEGPAPPNA